MKLVLTSLAAIFLAGCMVGPNYKRPAVDTPQQFRGDATPGNTNSLGDMPWWQLFRDDTLQDLIHIALTNNYDIRIAAERVEQSHQIVLETRSSLFPQLGYTGEAGVGRNAAVGNPFPGVGQSEWYIADGNASWEVDLWGRIRRMTESARAQYFATAEARTNVMISLIAQVATDYFQLLADDRLLEIARDTTNSFGQSLKLFSERLRGGVSSKLETSSAEAEEASAAATVPALEQQIAIAENQLSILLGLNPGPILNRKKLLEEELAPGVPAGLPSALLERRPDVREAEEQVHSANAEIGVAKADFFPQIDLSALGGQASSQFTAFATTGANAWAIGGSLVGPLYTGGRLKAQYREAISFWQESILQYRSIILNALQEVSNALIARDKLARERAEQQHAVNAYEEAVNVANQRYKAGQANYYELLQEQQLLFPAENSLTQTQLNQLLAIVQLYEALGGGWEQPKK